MRVICLLKNFSYYLVVVITSFSFQMSASYSVHLHLFHYQIRREMNEIIESCLNNQCFHS